MINLKQCFQLSNNHFTRALNASHSHSVITHYCLLNTQFHVGNCVFVEGVEKIVSVQNCVQCPSW